MHQKQLRAACLEYFVNKIIYSFVKKDRKVKESLYSLNKKNVMRTFSFIKKYHKQLISQQLGKIYLQILVNLLSDSRFLVTKN